MRNFISTPVTPPELSLPYPTNKWAIAEKGGSKILEFSLFYYYIPIISDLLPGADV
jgi:hypothetical protein